MNLAVSNQTSSADPTTVELVRRWKSGDSSAFELIMQRYSAPLLSYALRLVQQIQDGEEVVQDSFLRAFRSIHQLRDENNLWIWLKQIAHNTAMDLIKKTKRQPIATDPEEMQKLDSRREETSMLPQIIQAIESLPETFRETAIYYYLEEWPYSKIAETLQIEPAAVRQRISRVNRLLRETLGRKR
jgi:RNA polymerase sigma factor (sigma-70 family)